MKIKVFEYSNCSTCKQALKYLEVKKIVFERIAIIENPPSISELQNVLKAFKSQGGSIKNLFNTSGVLYRELGIAEKLKAGLSEKDALNLLSENGKLVKRPFVVTKDGGTVGFKPEAWNQFFKSMTRRQELSE
jgi:arsenate reductase